MKTFDQFAGDITINLAPTGEIWLGIGDVQSRALTEYEVADLIFSLEQFQRFQKSWSGATATVHLGRGTG